MAELQRGLERRLEAGVVVALFEQQHARAGVEALFRVGGLLLGNLVREHVADEVVDVARRVDDEREAHFVLEHVRVEEREAVLAHAQVLLALLVVLVDDVGQVEGEFLRDEEARLHDLLLEARGEVLALETVLEAVEGEDEAEVERLEEQLFFLLLVLGDVRLPGFALGPESVDQIFADLQLVVDFVDEGLEFVEFLLHLRHLDRGLLLFGLQFFDFHVVAVDDFVRFFDFGDFGAQLRVFFDEPLSLLNLQNLGVRKCIEYVARRRESFDLFILDLRQLLFDFFGGV